MDSPSVSLAALTAELISVPNLIYLILAQGITGPEGIKVLLQWFLHWALSCSSHCSLY